MNRTMTVEDVRMLIFEARSRWASDTRKVEPKLIHKTHVAHIEQFLDGMGPTDVVTVTLPDYIALTKS